MSSTPPPLPPPPLSFPLGPLCHRALTAPATLTPVERHTLLNRPPPAEENALCTARTGQTLADLVRKALSSSARSTSSAPPPPPPLSRLEADILVYGPAHGQRTREDEAARLAPYRALTAAQRDLVDRAAVAVSDPDEDRARDVAWKVLRGYQETERRAARTPADHTGPGAGGAQELRAQAMVFPWERGNWVDLVAEKGWEEWGLVVLRTAYGDEEAWRGFQGKFDALAAEELRKLSGAERIAGGFRLRYVEDEGRLRGQRQAALLAYMAEMRREGRIPPGFVQDYFIACDEDVVRTFMAGMVDWRVPVYDATFTVGDDEEGGYHGGLHVQAPLVFTLLLPKIVRGDRKPLKSLDLLGSPG